MTRTLAERIERRLNTLPIPPYAYNYGNDPQWYDRTLPNGHEITWADGYAEPGYPQCEVVLLSNWNDEYKSGYVPGPWKEGLSKYLTWDRDDTASRLADSLGKLDGVEIDWYDEYAVCDECNKAFRTVGDSYFWTMYGAINDAGCSCGDCIKADPEPFIDDYVNESYKAITFLDGSELEKAGWIKFENDDSYSGDYHSGWYGREDSPESIMSDIHDRGLSDVIFVIEGKGQFEVAFAPYVRAQEVIDNFGWAAKLIESAQATIDYNALN